jgi:RND family efflux transporter MFP subunit
MTINRKYYTSAGNWIVAANLLTAACSKTENDRTIEVDLPVTVQVSVPLKQEGESVSASGQVEAAETAIIGTRLMGFVSSVKVKPGDYVSKGQLLMVINSDDITAKRAQVQAMIAEAEAAFADAQKDFHRYQELQKQQSASEKEFENVKLRYNSAKSKLASVEQMENETEAMLVYANLVAPFAGIVTQKNIDEGSLAGPGMPLLVIENPNSFYVRTFVPEREVGELKKGMPADIIIKSTGARITGNLVEISPSSQFTAGQFQVKIAIPASKNDGLFSGMYVNVSIALQEKSQVQTLYVPVSAIVRKDQLTGLFTVGEDQTARLRWLKTGKENGNEIEILSGLTADEEFILQSEGRLYNGVPVQVEKTIAKNN